MLDGHNGKDATHYVRDNLPGVIVEDADFLQTDSEFADILSSQGTFFYNDDTYKIGCKCS